LVSESKLFDVPGLQPLRKELLEAALRFYKETANQRSADPGVLADLAVTYLQVCLIYTALDRNDDALVAAAQALDVIDRLRQQCPAGSPHYRKLAGFWKGTRPTKQVTALPRDVNQAFRTIRRLAETYEQLAQENPTVIAFQSDLAAVQTHIGALLADAGQREVALLYLQKAYS